MSKIKNVLAMLLALAMVLGTTLTTFAAGSAEIKINNAGADATFSSTQIVKANPATKTGWDIVDQYESYFLTAFPGLGEQDIIAGMIYSVSPTADKGVKIEGFEEKYAGALKAIFDVVPEGNEKSPITVTEAGVYFIKGVETDYTYNPMAAYVGFDKYTGAPTDLKDTVVEAKRAKTHIDKTAEDTDKVVEIGRTEIYHVTSLVPYIPTTDSNREYWVKDTITGAEYVTVESGDHAGKIELTVKIGSGNDEEQKHFMVR